MKDQHSDGKDLARAAQDYIEAHSAERFSLQEMAGALFVNGSYLLRVFKRRTGMTPLAYHYGRRIFTGTCHGFEYKMAA